MVQTHCWLSNRHLVEAEAVATIKVESLRESCCRRTTHLARGRAPLDDTHLVLVLASQVQEADRVKRSIVGLGILPKRPRAKLTNHMMLEHLVKDVDQDFPVWNRNVLLPRPGRSSADGKIMLYRRYCRQYYPENECSVGQKLRALARM